MRAGLLLLVVARIAQAEVEGAEPESGRPQGGTTLYVDSVAGRNSNPGSSPTAPWQDFSNLNGRTLHAGDRLLIKRGSVINQELRVDARSFRLLAITCCAWWAMTVSCG